MATARVSPGGRARLFVVMALLATTITFGIGARPAAAVPGITGSVGAPDSTTVGRLVSFGGTINNTGTVPADGFTSVTFTDNASTGLSGVNVNPVGVVGTGASAPFTATATINGPPGSMAQLKLTATGITAGATPDPTVNIDGASFTVTDAVDIAVTAERRQGATYTPCVGTCSVSIDDSIRYTVTVTNLGVVSPPTDVLPATDVRITAAVPSGTTGVSTTIPAGALPTPLQPGFPQSFTREVSVNDTLQPADAITFSASATYDVAVGVDDRPAIGSPASFGATVVDPRLTITNVLTDANLGQLLGGETVGSEIQIENTGNGDAENTVVTVNLDSSLEDPTAVTIDGVPAPAAQVTVAPSGLSLTVRIGTGANGTVGGTVLDGAAPIVIRFNTTAVAGPPGPAGTAQTTASVSFDGGGVSPKTTPSNTLPVLARPSVMVGIVPTPPTATPVPRGSNISYVVSATNVTGVGNATGVVISFPIPEETSFVSATASAGGSGPTGNPGGPITTTFATLAPGATATLTVVVQVSPTAVEDAGPANDIEAGASATFGPGTNPTANATPVAHEISVATLALTNLMVDANGPPGDPQLVPGEVVENTITVTNTGSFDATNTILSVALTNLGTPTNIEINGSPAAARATTAPNLLTVRLGVGANAVNGGTVTPGAEFQITFDAPVVAVPGGMPPLAQTSATIAFGNGGTSNGPVTAQIAILARPNIALSIATTPPQTTPVPRNTDITYVISAMNAVDVATATGVVVSFPIPEETTFVSAVASAGSTTPTGGPGGPITTTFATVAAGSTSTLTVVVRVNANAVQDPGPDNDINATASATYGPGMPSAAGASAAHEISVAELGITNTLNDENGGTQLVVGEVVNGLVRVTNTGTSISANTVVTVTLNSNLGPPTNVRIDGTPAGVRATTAGNVLTVRIGAGANGSSGGAVPLLLPIAVTFDAAVVAAGGAPPPVARTTATVAYGNGGATPPDAVAQIEIKTRPNVSLTIVPAPPTTDPVARGSQITYVINAMNAGGVADATNVVISFPIPEETTFVSATQSAGGSAPSGDPGGPITTTFATLPAGATATLTVVVQVDADAAEDAGPANDIDATATATYGPGTNPQAMAAVAHELSVARFAVTNALADTNGGQLIAGESVGSTVTVDNTGTADATDVVLTVALTNLETPTNVQIDGAAAPAAQVTTTPGQLVVRIGTGAGAAGGTITPAAAPITVTFDATVVTSPTGAPPQAQTSASVTFGNGGILGPTTTAPVPAPPLEIKADPNVSLSITPTPPVTSSISRDTQITYVVRATNAAGVADATNVTISFPIPEETTFVSAVASAGGTAFPGGPGDPGPITTTFTLVPAGSSSTLTIVVQVDADASRDAGPANDIEASASATYGPGTNPPATAAVAHELSSADLAIAGTEPPDLVIDGPAQPLTYTLSVTDPDPAPNNTDPAEDVTVTIAVPAEVEAMAVTTEQGTCNPVPGGLGGTLTCTIGDVAIAGPVDIVVSLVGRDLVATVDVVATATSTNDDPDTTNNTASVPVTVIQQPVDLALSEVADRRITTTGPTDTAEQGTFPVTVTNNGDFPTRSYRLTVDLPAGTVDAALTSGDPDCVTAANVVTCERPAALLEGTPQTFVITAEIKVDGPIVVRATVVVDDPEQVDPVAANNATTWEITRNLRPDAVEDVGPTVPAGATLLYDVLSNDVENDAADVPNLFVTVAASPSGLTVSVPPGGNKVQVVVAAGMAPETIALGYTIDDLRGGTESATLTVRVAAAATFEAVGSFGTPPLDILDSFGAEIPSDRLDSTPEDIDVLDDDLGELADGSEFPATVDHDLATVSADSLNVVGSAVAPAAGATAGTQVARYTPAPGYTSEGPGAGPPDSFTYTTTAIQGGTELFNISNAKVEVRVKNQNPIGVDSLFAVPNGVTQLVTPADNDLDGNTRYQGSPSAPVVDPITVKVPPQEISFDDEGRLALDADGRPDPNRQLKIMCIGPVPTIDPLTNLPGDPATGVPLDPNVVCPNSGAATGGFVKQDADLALTNPSVTVPDENSNGQVTVRLAGATTATTVAFRTVTATADATVVGDLHFAYVIVDARGGAGFGRATIRVPNTPPQIIEGVRTVLKNTPTVVVDTRDAVQDANADTIVISGAPARTTNGSIVRDDRTITYTPDKDYLGPDELLYSVSDGRGDGSASAILQINVIDQPGGLTDLASAGGSGGAGAGSPGGNLAATGGDPLPLTAAAGCSLLLGLALVQASRRRRSLPLLQTARHLRS